MPAPINHNVKLRDIIWLYSDAARKSQLDFRRLWTICFRGFIQFGLNATWQPKTIRIKVNDNKTATLPDDFIQWVKIGFMSGGELVTMSVNDTLTDYNAKSANRVSDLSVDDVSALSSSSYYDAWGVLVKEHSRINGSAKLDMENRCILLNTDFDNEHLMLQYISSPQMDDDYAIPIQFQEAMIDFLAWKDTANIPSTNKTGRGDKNDARLQFARQLKLAKRMYKPFRPSDYI